MRAPLLALLLLVSADALAQDRVAFAGLSSPELSAVELARVEESVGKALERLGRSLPRGETLGAISSSPAIARGREDARAAAAAGAAALKTFDVATAGRELDRAASLYGANHGARLVPNELARVHEQRAMMLYAQGETERMRQAIALAVRAAPSRAPDPKALPPEVLAAWSAELAELRASPPALAEAHDLSELARRAGTRWIATGEARVRDGGLEIFLALGSTEARVVTHRARVPQRDALAAFADSAVAALLENAGLSRAAPITIVTPRRAEPPRKKRDTRPWLIGGAIVIAAGAAAAIAASQPGPSGGGTTRNDDVIILFPPPQ